MEEPGEEWRIILKWILEKWGGGIVWIERAQDMDRWWAFLNAVMDLRVRQNAGNFLTRLGPGSFSGKTLLHGIGWLVGRLVGRGRSMKKRMYR